MKKEFEMTQDELNQMIAISQGKSMPVLMIGSVVTGGEKQESANDFWKRLGEKYGFIWDTAEPISGKGYTFFKAVAKPNPMEQYETDLKEHKEHCEKIKPKRENYLTKQAFSTDMSEWDRKLSMDAPNKPGYYRANND